MPMWRCPHCGTPQAETSRCWVCRRSSTSCGSCRHFRRSVAAQLGYCGLDRQRRPLRGDEIRACWEGLLPAEAAEDERPVLPPAFVAGRAARAAAGSRPASRVAVVPRGFVPVGTAEAGSGTRPAASVDDPPDPEALPAGSTPAGSTPAMGTPGMGTPAASTPPAAADPSLRVGLWGDLEG